MPASVPSSQRVNFMRPLCVALCFSSGTFTAAAAEYPVRPVRMIVLCPPGGSDTVARMLAQKLSERFHQTFVVDNRPGAAGVIGADIVAKSPPDGYTLLFATASFAISAGFDRKLPYDTVKDFSSVGFVASVPFVLFVGNSVSHYIKVHEMPSVTVNIYTSCKILAWCD